MSAGYEHRKCPSFEVLATLLILTPAAMEGSAFRSSSQNKPCLHEQDWRSSAFQESVLYPFTATKCRVPLKSRSVSLTAGLYSEVRSCSPGRSYLKASPKAGRSERRCDVGQSCSQLSELHLWHGRWLRLGALGRLLH